jgi:hypothetical protein
MSKRLVVTMLALSTILSLSSVLHAQTSGQPESTGEQKEWWNNSPPNKAELAAQKRKAAPAPRRDLSGIWDGTAEGGIQPKGPIEYIDDDKHIGHDVPYTALGRAARKLNKAGEGVDQVAQGDLNDPVDFCDPQGFPRMELYELRVIELAQTKNQVIYLDQFYDQWRVIWTDGRPLPKDPESRWNGYSVGKWVDDYTFVVDSVGMDDRTWLDNVGRPHSEDLRVQETWHRVDSDTLELSVKIDDPKMYTQPWMALNKFVLHRLPDDYDMREFICSVSETQSYNKGLGDRATEFAHRPPANAGK